MQMELNLMGKTKMQGKKRDRFNPSTCSPDGGPTSFPLNTTLKSEVLHNIFYKSKNQAGSDGIQK